MSDSSAAAVLGPVLKEITDALQIDMDNAHDMMAANIKNMPLRSLVGYSQGRLSEEMLEKPENMQRSINSYIGVPIDTAYDKVLFSEYTRNLVVKPLEYYTERHWRTGLR